MPTNSQLTTARSGPAVPRRRGSTTSAASRCRARRRRSSSTGCGELLRRLGNPQDGLPIVHVAGTKGKGSTSAMIAAVLSAAGYRTGLFTSPHLDRVEERIAVDGRPCSADELAGSGRRLRSAGRSKTLGSAAAEPEPVPTRGPTYFEILTAMALLHFVRQRVRRGRAGGRTGRPAGFDQRLHAAGVGHHQHQLRPHPAVGRHVGGHRRGKGRHHQARRAGRQRRNGRRTARSDPPNRPRLRLPTCGTGTRFRLRISSSPTLGKATDLGNHRFCKRGRVRIFQQSNKLDLILLISYTARSPRSSSSRQCRCGPGNA